MKRMYAILAACLLVGSTMAFAQEDNDAPDMDMSMIAMGDNDAPPAMDMPMLAMGGMHGQNGHACMQQGKSDDGPQGMEPGCCGGMQNDKGNMGKGCGMMGGCEGHHGGLIMLCCRPGMEKVLEDAGIAQSTITKLADMGTTCRTTCEGTMIKVQREELNIREQLLKDAPDMQAIQTSVNNKAQLLADLEFSKIKMEQDIKALVSKDDMKKIMTALKEKRQDMKQGKCCDKQAPAPDKKK
jgi:hypothetical protein